MCPYVHGAYCITKSLLSLSPTINASFVSKYKLRELTSEVLFILFVPFKLDDDIRSKE